MLCLWISHNEYQSINSILSKNPPIWTSPNRKRLWNTQAKLASSISAATTTMSGFLDAMSPLTLRAMAMSCRFKALKLSSVYRETVINFKWVAVTCRFRSMGTAMRWGRLAVLFYWRGTKGSAMLSLPTKNSKNVKANNTLIKCNTWILLKHNCHRDRKGHNYLKSHKGHNYRKDHNYQKDRNYRKGHKCQKDRGFPNRNLCLSNFLPIILSTQTIDRNIFRLPICTVEE